MFVITFNYVFVKTMVKYCLGLCINCKFNTFVNQFSFYENIEIYLWSHKYSLLSTLFKAD